ncbi:hypothetical protein B0J13DRAFT_314180 [Dactylonectria estremocensis]|uniref:Uncharacterized protein n=1 Tax=Dactylonectria estremocensis TaxID=1079267 RepID=A0A9P9F0S3_9HYPO|nr:hypothetical protein B0J13DRAFT_314180 [Dactylonectria estremocensis]
MLVCKACKEPLVLPLGPEDTDLLGSGDIPDDLGLPCGCHFHWQCLLDQSSELVLSLKCPNCAAYLPGNEAGPSTTNTSTPASSGTVILAKYVNEGGVQDNLDILPSITEEAYLQTHPEARPARALHLMCTAGDAIGIVELLRDASDEVDDMGSLIRYQDPLDELKSGLHHAIMHSQDEVTWLLLWLSSTLPNEAFPDSVRQTAESMDIGRLHVTVDGDIRGLQDAQGQTAGALAQRLQVPWLAMSGAGLLSI